MAERITLTREQMGPGRKTMDTLIGGGNFIDIGVIAVGVLTANPVLAGAGVASYAMGKEVQNEWVRKRTVKKGAEKYGSHMRLAPKADIFVKKK